MVSCIGSGGNGYKSLFKVEFVPRELRERKRWIVWKAEVNNGKVAKIPLAPWFTNDLRAVSVVDENNWTDFETAVVYAKRYGLGLGFVLGDGIVGIDLDDCIGENEVSEMAWEIVKRADTYAEISPSGKGIHVIGFGRIPKAVKTDGLEIYADGRFFTFTGDYIEKKELGDIQGVLDDLFKALEGEGERGGIDVVKVLEAYGLNKVLKRVGKQLQGMHPRHGSKTGMNFSVNVEKGTWFCYRHWVGGGVVSLVALLEGWISCEDVEKGLSEEVKRKALKRLSELGVHVEPRGVESEKKQSFAVAMEILENRIVDLFLDEYDEEVWATVRLDDGTLANFKVHSREFDALVNTLFYKEEGVGLRKEVRKDIAETLDAKARIEKKVKRLEMLGCVEDGRILIDMGNEKWDVIEVDNQGFRVVNLGERNPFKRCVSTKKLPVPQDVDDPLAVLLSLLPANVENAEDVKRVFPVWLITIPLTHIPRPGLCIIGSHGSGKSTFTELIQRIFTNQSPQTLPDAVKDCAVAIHNSPLATFDNVKRIDDEIVSVLCTAITFGHYVGRKLYTDEETVKLFLKSVVNLNGIAPLITKHADLVDRLIFIKLRMLEDAERKERVEILRELNENEPRVLGAVCKGLSLGLRHLDQVRAELKGKVKVRMVDWVIWGEAIARGLGMKPFEFVNAYLRLIKESELMVLEEDAVGKAMMLLIEELKGLAHMDVDLKNLRKHNLPFEAKGLWVGTATDLLEKLKGLLRVEAPDMELELPQSRFLTRRLKELEPNLASVGVRISFDRIGHSGTRVVVVRVECEPRGECESVVIDSDDVGVVVDGEPSGADNADNADNNSILLYPKTERVMMMREEGGRGYNNRKSLSASSALSAGDGLSLDSVLKYDTPHTPWFNYVPSAEEMEMLSEWLKRKRCFRVDEFMGYYDLDYEKAKAVLSYAERQGWLEYNRFDGYYEVASLVLERNGGEGYGKEWW